MDSERHDAYQLVFQADVGRLKPFTVREDDDSVCPFCHRGMLPPILREDGDILLVPNKYPILQNTDPFVLIETAECESELSLYSEDHLVRVFQMAFTVWREMMADKRYRSVLFLKNHGPLSGGSLRHPHMQLIGLYDIDYHEGLRRDSFYGPVIHSAPGAELNISDRPRIGFTEFNAILTDEKGFRAFCLLIQQAVGFVLRRYHSGQIGSYNLFFYAMDGATYCKIMPRYATTPVFMGYAIPQVTDDLDAIVREMKVYCHY
ncbi:MAG: DUF4931 domain-containing protein [Clostridiales bacterium]|nr:DUF4931 domain-containing protein [Clostridiales bacterium]